MNGLVQSLSEQARDYANRENEDFGESLVDAFKAKFADLIIDEVLTICDQAHATYKYSLTPSRARAAEQATHYLAHMIAHKFKAITP